MKFVIDTHILLWWYLNKSELPQNYRTTLLDLEQKGEEIGISVISLWEIATLVAGNKYEIKLSLDKWFEELEEDEMVKILSLNRHIILDSKQLGKTFPKDPADQLIAATARYHGLPLMTVDDRIRKSGMVALV